MGRKGIFITVATIVITTIVALFFTALDIILGVTGAIACTQLMIIIPGMLQWKLQIIQSKINYFYVALSGFVIFAGIIIMIISMWGAIYSATS